MRCMAFFPSGFFLSLLICVLRHSPHICVFPLTRSDVSQKCQRGSNTEIIIFLGRISRETFQDTYTHTKKERKGGREHELKEKTTCTA